MNRLSFDDLEAICEQEGCHFNELFLIGEEAFVMIDRMKATIAAGGYELNWRVRVTTEEGGQPVLAISRDGVVQLP